MKKSDFIPGIMLRKKGSLDVFKFRSVHDAQWIQTESQAYNVHLRDTKMFVFTFIGGIELEGAIDYNDLELVDADTLEQSRVELNNFCEHLIENHLR